MSWPDRLPEDIRVYRFHSTAGNLRRSDKFAFVLGKATRNIERSKKLEKQLGKAQKRFELGRKN